jgi:DNA-binding HxlR family transcriptional regulator
MMTVTVSRKKAQSGNKVTSMKPDKRYLSENCQAVSEVLQRVGDKWTVLVVKTLGRGPMRFNELKRAIDGVSQRMLTLTLRALERDGLVTRTVYPSVPPRVEYELTQLGRSLIAPVTALAMWAIDHRGAIDGARTKFDAREPGKASKQRAANGSYTAGSPHEHRP